MRSQEQDGIGHARHRLTREALPAAISRRRHGEALRARAVVQVALEDAPLDEHRPDRFVSLVIDVDRAPRLHERRVVHDAAQRARDRFADLAAVPTRPPADVVGFQAVADRFVQEDAAVACSEHDIELAQRSRASIEHRDRLASRLSAMMLGASGIEVAEAHAPPTTAKAFLPRALPLRHGTNAESQERLHVVDQSPVARGNQDLADFLGQAHLCSDDGRIECQGRLARSLQ